jgi:integrase/recombinase XerD
MKLAGPDGVIAHYLMDVDNRLGDLTVVSYTQRLEVLVRLLETVCRDAQSRPVVITELEQVTALYLRQCVQYLLNNRVSEKGRPPALGDRLSPSAVGSYVRIWKAFFSWCFQEELIEANPAARLKLPKTPKKVTPAFTSEQVERMLAVCDTRTVQGFRDYVILLLLLDTGIRIGEIASLTVDSVNFQGGYVTVEGKGSKQREVGIHPEMSKLLWKYIQKYRKPANPDERALFLGQRGALSDAGVQQVIKRVQKQAGLEDVEMHAHVFRHTHSKVYTDQGGDVLKLSRELGHSSLRTTEVYLRSFGSSDAIKDHNSHSPLAGMHFRKKGKGRHK